MSQNNYAEPVNKSSERARKGEIIQQRVSENILGLYYIVQRLHDSRIRLKLADRGSKLARYVLLKLWVV